MSMLSSMRRPPPSQQRVTCEMQVKPDLSMAELHTESKRTVWHAFNMLDTQGTGKVDVTQLKEKIMSTLGLKLGFNKAEEYLKDNDTSLDFETFYEIVKTELIDKLEAISENGGKSFGERVNDIVKACWTLCSFEREQKSQSMTSDHCLLLWRLFNFLSETDESGNPKIPVCLDAEEAAMLFKDFIDTTGQSSLGHQIKEFLNSYSDNSLLTFTEFLNQFEKDYINGLSKNDISHGVHQLYDKYILNILIKGMMWKRGYKVKSWKERWLVLTPICLKYYVTSSERDMKGQIDFDSACNVEVPPDRATNKPNRFVIHTTKKPYDMSASDIKTKNEWVSAIHTALDNVGKDPNVQKLAALERCQARAEKRLLVEEENRKRKEEKELNEKRQYELDEEKRKRQEDEDLLKERLKELEEEKRKRQEEQELNEKRQSELDEEKRKRQEDEDLLNERLKDLEEEKRRRTEEEQKRREEAELSKKRQDELDEEKRKHLADEELLKAKLKELDEEKRKRLAEEELLKAKLNEMEEETQRRTEEEERIRRDDAELIQKRQHELDEEKRKRLQDEKLLNARFEELEEEKRRRTAAEARAQEEQALREAEQDRLRELEEINRELERLLAEERQARKDEETARSRQAQLLEEEFEKRKELELLKLQQEDILKSEREQKAVLESDKRKKEQSLLEAQCMLEELEKERAAAADKMQEATEKLSKAEHDRQIMEEKYNLWKKPIGLARPVVSCVQPLITHRGVGSFCNADFISKWKDNAYTDHSSDINTNPGITAKMLLKAKSVEENKEKTDEMFSKATDTINATGNQAFSDPRCHSIPNNSEYFSEALMFTNKNTLGYRLGNGNQPETNLNMLEKNHSLTDFENAKVECINEDNVGAQASVDDIPKLFQKFDEVLFTEQMQLSESQSGVKTQEVEHQVESQQSSDQDSNGKQYDCGLPLKDNINSKLEDNNENNTCKIQACDSTPEYKNKANTKINKESELQSFGKTTTVTMHNNEGILDIDNSPNECISPQQISKDSTTKNAAVGQGLDIENEGDVSESSFQSETKEPNCITPIGALINTSENGHDINKQDAESQQQQQQNQNSIEINEENINISLRQTLNHEPKGEHYEAICNQDNISLTTANANNEELISEQNHTVCENDVNIQKPKLQPNEKEQTSEKEVTPDTGCNKSSIGHIAVINETEPDDRDVKSEPQVTVPNLEKTCDDPQQYDKEFNADDLIAKRIQKHECTNETDMMKVKSHQEDQIENEIMTDIPNENSSVTTENGKEKAVDKVILDVENKVNSPEENLPPLQSVMDSSNADSLVGQILEIAIKGDDYEIHPQSENIDLKTKETIEAPQ